MVCCYLHAETMSWSAGALRMEVIGCRILVQLCFVLEAGGFGPDVLQSLFVAELDAIEAGESVEACYEEGSDRLTLCQNRAKLADGWLTSAIRDQTRRSSRVKYERLHCESSCLKAATTPPG